MIGPCKDAPQPNEAGPGRVSGRPQSRPAARLRRLTGKIVERAYGGGGDVFTMTSASPRSNDSTGAPATSSCAKRSASSACARTRPPPSGVLAWPAQDRPLDSERDTALHGCVARHYADVLSGAISRGSASVSRRGPVRPVSSAAVGTSCTCWVVLPGTSRYRRQHQPRHWPSEQDWSALRGTAWDRTGSSLAPQNFGAIM